MKAGAETMDKFYQAEHRSCSDFESKCHNEDNSTDEDTTIFVQAGKRKKQHGKYTKLKRKESNRHLNKTESNVRYDKFKVKTKRKRRCCPLPTIAFCFCWLLLVFITFVTLLKFTKPEYFPMRRSAHIEKSIDEVFSLKKETSVRPCDDFDVVNVWSTQYHGFMSESAVRLIDVNQDGVDDIITGFTSDRDHLYNATSLCSSGNATYLCGSGGVAINGKSGKVLWIHYTEEEVFAINCNGDVTFDGVPDCLLGGRAGVFVAVDGSSGKRLWIFKDQPVYTNKMNLYTGQFVQDLDDDGVMEVLQTNGGDILAEPFSKERLAGRILIISGKSGEVITWMETPDKKETYFSPVVYTLRNGTDVVVFGTGGETHGGTLYVIQLHHLYRGEIDLALQIHKDDFKGFMNPPVLVDIDEDGTVDMVFAFFNSTIAAINGETFSLIWSYSVPHSESYSIPSPGYFNQDDTIDFMVKVNVGPGFPTYYHSIVSVIDGISGKPITNPLTSSVATFDSPLSISMEGRGNDLFLFWLGDCLSHEGRTEQFASVDPGVFDSCRLRFKTRETHQLCITNRARKGACQSMLEAGYDYLEGKLHKRKQRHSPSGSKHDFGKTHLSDVDFVQRVMGTGALVHALEAKVGASHDAIDLIVVEVWLKSLGEGITKQDIGCIEKYNKEHGRNFSDLKEENGIAYDRSTPAFDNCITQKSKGASNENPRNKTEGNSTERPAKTIIHRLRLRCVCSKGKNEEKCANFLPIQKQRWAGYMGSLGNGYLNDVT